MGDRERGKDGGMADDMEPNDAMQRQRNLTWRLAAGGWRQVQSGEPGSRQRDPTLPCLAALHLTPFCRLPSWEMSLQQLNRLCSSPSW